MAEEVGDDAALLSTLGVTAENPDDIERSLLAQVKQKVRERQIFGDSDDDEEAGEQDDYGEDNARAVLRFRLEKQLSALDREIEAVADGAQAFQVSVDEAAAAERSDRTEEQMLENEEDPDGAVGRGAALHHALATDRLKSLLLKKKEVRAQLRALSKQEQEEEDVVRTLVEDTSQAVDSKRKGKKKVQVAAPPKPVKKTVSYIQDDDFDAALDAASGLMETERDRLIRTGMLTPFDRVKGFERKVQRAPRVETDDEIRAKQSAANLASSLAAAAMFRPTSKLLDASELPTQEPPTREFRRLRAPLRTRTEAEEGQSKVKRKAEKRPKRPQAEMKWRKRANEVSDEDYEVDEEDESWSEGEEERPKKRSKKSKALLKHHEEDGSEGEEGLSEEDVVLDGGLKLPAKIYNKLFDYQKTGVKWLWELHCQNAGGIIGDEMGLGKTIQVLVFLAGLHNSGMYIPSIVICPVTLLRQWKREAKKWYPAFNVEILHDSGLLSPQKTSKKKKGKAKRESGDDYEEEESDFSEEELQETAVAVTKENKWDALIDRVIQSSDGILLTTYEQLRIVRDKLLDFNWGYAILDEGHRIRNPDAAVTLVCKQLQTVHRIIMTGAPIQNRLTELWSLFDFVFPGKLGVLPVFQAQFALPIAIGGYSNATPLQVSTAYRCAVVLRDLIMPYLLRRMKSDVDAQLPKKTEHVLFCSLTKDQRAAYRAFLASSEVEQIFDGNRNSLYGIDILRKICNHPDLLEREQGSAHPDYGNPERSGKLVVLAQILDLWKTQGHRVLLFSQTQQMLDIIENYVTAKGFVYRRMDGNTPVKQRMALIDEFNEGDHVFIFILTTKVGGLGTNLIGANRVVIFDPDWNPSTDMQARERAWRIGQTREVVIYRLITRGTIEEKVYHRQIYKHFLTNKILRDPQQRRFFKARDMRDLFTLQEENAVTETSTLFAEVGGNIEMDKKKNDVDRNLQKTRVNGRKGRTRSKDLEDSALNNDRPEQKDKVKEDDGEPQEEESRILKNLFEANGIHSAMDHDAILGVHESEKAMIDHEASRVAERAALALQQSRRLRSSENVAVPTWTGRSGTAGAPAAVRQRFGSTSNSRLVSSSSTPSQSQTRSGESPGMESVAGASAGRAFTSADLLARMRERKLGTPGASRNEPTEAGPSSRPTTSRPPSGTGRNGPVPAAQPEVLIRQLCTFIQKEGGSAASSHVVNQFRDRISSRDVPLFRQLLKQIAVLQKGSQESKWVLKPEYQER